MAFVETFKKFLKDKRGIETRVLIFILAAIILVLLIAMITGLMGQVSDMLNRALFQANETLGGST
jgi:Flp pilus assembly pilin Flp